MRAHHSLLFPSIGILFAGCAVQQDRVCEAGLKPMRSAYLYFGTTKPVGQVSQDEWQDFLSKTVTPRFPDGLSVWSASGQWRSSAGGIEREASYVLNIVHPRREADFKAFEEIIKSYKAQYQQEAVLQVETKICARF